MRSLAVLIAVMICCAPALADEPTIADTPTPSVVVEVGGEAVVEAGCGGCEAEVCCRPTLLQRIKAKCEARRAARCCQPCCPPPCPPKPKCQPVPCCEPDPCCKPPGCFARLRARLQARRCCKPACH